MAETAEDTEVGMMHKDQFDTEVAVEGEDHMVVPISSCLAVVSAREMVHEVHCFLSPVEGEILEEVEVAQEF